MLPGVVICLLDSLVSPVRSTEGPDSALPLVAVQLLDDRSNLNQWIIAVQQLQIYIIGLEPSQLIH